MPEIDPEKVAKAIEDLEYARHTHVAWADFLRGGTPYEPTKEDVGSIEDHDRWIEKYDNALEVLRTVAG